MDNYTYLSEVYDIFMDNIPYEDWSKYIICLLKEHNVDTGLVLDLGCGTGAITELLASEGYDLIGVDSSQEMLSMAYEKKELSKNDILYICQDMRELELYGTVKAAVSVCDSLNYINNSQDLLKVFKLVNNYLDPKGIFIFDINTPEKYKKIGDRVIAENREDSSFIWENSYFENEEINQYDVTMFIEDNSGKYDKVEETHIQKAYSFEEIKKIIDESGLEFVCAYDSYTNNPCNKESERICFVCKEKGKAG